MLAARLGAAQSSTTLERLLINDMTLPHQAALDGVPSSYDWATGPRMGFGNKPGPDGSWTAATAWGQVYSSNNPSTNTLVEVRNLSLAVLSPGGSWTVLQSTRTAGSTSIDAGFFASDYVGNVTAPAAPKTTVDLTRAGRPNVGHNMHFFPAGRAAVAWANIAGVVAWFDARLILDNPAGFDDRASAKFLAGAGADYWIDDSAGWSADFSNNGDIAIARLRWVTSDWQTFTMSTLTPAQIQVTPPPITLAGSAGATGGGGGMTSTGWQRPVGRPVRIMPLGDSITAYQGTDSTGWATMPARFSSQGWAIETVGTQVGHGGFKHEGHGAWCADDNGQRCTHTNGFHAGGLIQSAGPWLTTHQPDVVVLNIGTNDRFVSSGYTDNEVRDAVSTLLDIITASVPNAMVYLTKLRYSDELTDWDTNANLNDLYADLVAQKQVAGKLVRIFDAYASVNQLSDFRDLLHPSAQGVGKMMDATFSELHALLLGAAPTSNPELPTVVVNPAWSTFSHDFPGSTLDAGVWDTDLGFGSAPTVSGNEVLVGSGFVSVKNKDALRLTDSSVQFRLRLPSNLGTYEIMLRNHGLSLPYLRVAGFYGSPVAGQVGWTASISGVTSGGGTFGSGAMPVSGLTHYLRLRHSGSTFYVEHSATGAVGSWTTLASTSVPVEFTLDSTSVAFGSQGSFGGDAAYGKINVMPAGAAFSTFIHDFPGFALDAGVWDNYGGSITVAANAVKIPVTSYSGINTDVTFSLIDSSVHFKVDPTGATGGSWYVQLRCDGSDARTVTLSGYRNAGTWDVKTEGSAVGTTTQGSGSYSYGTDQWFRFRHSSSTGRLYVEKAPSGPGGSWTTLCDFAPPVGYDLTNMDLQLATRDGATGFVTYSKVNVS